LSLYYDDIIFYRSSDKKLYSNIYTLFKNKEIEN
jgi:hypothetical protein